MKSQEANASTYCSYTTKNNKECSIKGKDIYTIDECRYCKKHYDMLHKQKLKESQINYCAYINKNNNKCNTKAKDIYNLDEHKYCKKHYDMLNKKNQKKHESTNINKTNHVVNDHKEEDEIIKEINYLKNIHITSNNKINIKKKAFKLLLKVHPDKCKFKNLDSHELTQIINDNILNKVNKI